MYTENTFEFETSEQAQNFHKAVEDQIGFATDYFKNNNEEIHVRIDENDKNKVIIYYGKKPDEE